MLRDLLRSVPGLYCPEETHFYRWGQPYRTPQYQRQYLKNKTLERHRDLDGITEEEVIDLFDRSHSRREFTDGYLALYLEKLGAPAGARWFDKTPQNVFGLSMLAHDYPQSRFVHLYRNPLNVVASLKVGKVMSLPDPVAAANYWRESVIIAETFRAANPHRMVSVSYEDLTHRPVTEVDAICEFVGVETPDGSELSGVKPEANQFERVLEAETIALVRTITASVVEEYGYHFEKF